MRDISSGCSMRVRFIISSWELMRVLTVIIVERRRRIRVIIVESVNLISVKTATRF